MTGIGSQRSMKEGRRFHALSLAGGLVQEDNPTPVMSFRTPLQIGDVGSQ